MNILSGCVIFILFIIICLLVLVALVDPRYYDSKGDEDDT